MPDNVTAGATNGCGTIGEAACVHSCKVYDSCQSKDCIEDLRVYPTTQSAQLLERAVSVKAGGAELLYVDLSVQPVSFHKGFYAVDARYYYRITADAFVGGVRPVPVCGMAVFDKRAILYGSEGCAKMFTSGGGAPEQCGLPNAVIEAVDPVVLALHLTDGCEARPGEPLVTEAPAAAARCFDGELVFGQAPGRRLYVTLGQFSILRLERDTHLLMPVYDYCMPDKECTCGGGEEDPCELFQQVDFPVEAFFPSGSCDREPICPTPGGVCQ